MIHRSLSKLKRKKLRKIRRIKERRRLNQKGGKLKKDEKNGFSNVVCGSVPRSPDVRPLRNTPVTHKGSHWAITRHVGETISGEVIGRKFNIRVPEELENADLFTPMEIAIFRRLLTLVNLHGIGRAKAQQRHG